VSLFFNINILHIIETDQVYISQRTSSTTITSTQELDDDDDASHQSIYFDARMGLMPKRDIIPRPSIPVPKRRLALIESKE